MRLSLIVAAAAVLLAGCSATCPEIVKVIPADHIALQIYTPLAMSLPARSADLAPEVTVWGNGRTVFVTPDGVIREAVLTGKVVDQLMQKAKLLDTLPGTLEFLGATDIPTTYFTAETDQGRKTVAVTSLAPVYNPTPDPIAQLRALREQILAALPADAPRFQPASVTVKDYPTIETPATITDWPPGAGRYVTG
jgi:hypothetical protein